jgi:heme-binding NEAT domain protein
LGGRGRWISEFKASLVYRVSSRTARAIQRNPVSKTKQNKTKQNKTKTNQNKPKQKKKKKKRKTSKEKEFGFRAIVVQGMELQGSTVLSHRALPPSWVGELRRKHSL